MKKTSQQNKPPTASNTEKPLFPARTFPSIYLLPGDPPAPSMQLTAEQQRTWDKIKADAAAADERGEAGFLAAIKKGREKAIKIRNTLVRLVEMLRRDEKAHLAESVDAFLVRLQDVGDKEPLVFDALLLGAELGADTDTGNMLRQIAADQAKTMPYLAGVPAVVEQANENKREGMGELYRRIYAPGFTPKQKAIADAMRETGNHVRQTTPILKKWKWKGISPGRVSIELGKMDKLFANARMTNPFASRKDNRKRPVAEITYHKRKVDPDDPDSAVDFIPNDPRGYRHGKTEGETPRNT